MLPLDSAVWQSLSQAYGSAEDIPRLIEHLDIVRGGELDALWLGLWATLWREGRVYTASYAALPHLVAYSARQSVNERARALHLVAAIEVARATDLAPPLPDELAAAYHDALSTIPACVAASVAEPWSADTTQILTAVLAIAKGHVKFGAAALDWVPENPV